MARLGRALKVHWQSKINTKNGVAFKQNGESTVVINFDVKHLRAFILTTALILVLAGCSSSKDSDDDDGGNQNRAPTANAGANASVAETTVVTLDGTGSTDPDANDSLTYSWTQTGGTSLTITNANQEQASFTAPDVTLGSPQDFTFQLTVTDGEGLTSTDSVTITVVEPAPQITLSGIAEFQFVPPFSTPQMCAGLNYSNTENRPIRGVTIQLFDAGSNTLIAESETSETGAYSFVVDSQINVFLRLRAELKRVGAPAWDVEVRDNTSDVGLALDQRPLYVLDTAPFTTSVVNQTENIVAATGWDGSDYSGVRAAAPFSILDAIYDAMQLVLTANPTANFPPLDAFWSVNNSSTQGSGSFNDNIDNGLLGTSFYSGGIDSLFLLGMEDDDTEEFDDHVIAHEWGHYFEDTFSRSDSVGGAHAIGNRLDARLAFGEGWGTAISGMSTGVPVYCDTGGNNQSGGFGIDIETPGAFSGTPGWYNETTILALLYDLWDTDNDGVDNDSIGFAPIYDIMVNQQRTTPAFTSVFSFMTELKADNPGATTFIDALLTDSGITSNLDIYGSNETNDSDNSLVVQDVLPVYTTITTNGTPVEVCSNSQFDNVRDGNKLSERQLLRFDVITPAIYEISVVTNSPNEIPPPGFNCELLSITDPDAHRYSDPDFFVYRNGNIAAFGRECTPNQEPPETVALQAGEHVMSVLEFRYADDDTIASYPERTCFNVSITQQ